MNNLEYLNEISKSNRPEKVAPTHTALIIKIAIGVVIFVLALVLFGKAVGNSATTSDLLKQLYLSTNSLNSTVTTYNRSLKSSNLRATSISLSAALANANNQLTGYFTVNELDPTPSETLTARNEAAFTELDTTLNNAKLNGILDRIYASQIQLQVSLLLSLIAQNLDRTKDSTLASLLDSYRSNLSLISDSLEAYSR